MNRGCVVIRFKSYDFHFTKNAAYYNFYNYEFQNIYVYDFEKMNLKMRKRKAIKNSN